MAGANHPPRPDDAEHYRIVHMMVLEALVVEEWMGVDLAEVAFDFDLVVAAVVAAVGVEHWCLAHHPHMTCTIR